MDPTKPVSDLPQATTQAGTAPFDFEYRPAADVNPLDLLGNAHLALHHHMAPADGGFDLGGEDAD